MKTISTFVLGAGLAVMFGAAAQAQSYAPTVNYFRTDAVPVQTYGISSGRSVAVAPRHNATIPATDSDGETAFPAAN